MTNSLDSPNYESQPKLLVSVRNAAEAQAALDGGADWIDLKEPREGALGAVEASVATDVVQTVGAAKPVSAALGELAHWPDSQARKLLSISGIDVVKLGLADCASRPSWHREWLAVEADVRHAGKQLAAVAYADSAQANSPTPAEIIKLARQTSCEYFLLDTYHKNSGSIFAYLNEIVLSQIICSARQASLKIVVAGGLDFSALSRLREFPIDLVAIRGAACNGGRNGPVDSMLVTRLRQSLTTRPTRTSQLEDAESSEIA